MATMGVARVLVVVAALVLGAALPAAGTVDDEHAMLSLINETRAEADLPPLTPLGDLVDDARLHTAEMIAVADLFHSSSKEIASYASGWSLLGENVGFGPNPKVLHRAFMLSETHAANVLGEFSFAGVGASRSSDGSLYVTVLFMQPAESDDTELAEFSPLDDLWWFTDTYSGSTLVDRMWTSPEPTAPTISARCHVGVCAD